MNDAILSALAIHSTEKQIEQTIEELAELILAIQKYKRHCATGHVGFEHEEADVRGEVADVLIMCQQLQLVFLLSKSQLAQAEHSYLRRIPYTTSNERIEIAVEALAELALALQRHKRRIIEVPSLKLDVQADLRVKLANVMIFCKQLQVIFDLQASEAAYAEKLLALEEKVKRWEEQAEPWYNQTHQESDE